MKKIRLPVRMVLGVILLVCALTVHAQDVAERKVRVGFFQFTSYQQVDERGNRSGYGYEYLQEIAKHTGWQYEYVTASWEDCLEMLERGEIDLLGSAQYTAERGEKFDYPSLNSGISYAVLCVKESNTTIAYEDFEAFDGMTIGLLKGNSRNNRLADYCAENGFSVATSLYENEQALLRALEFGEVDAVLTSNLRKGDEERVVARFAPSPFYYIVKKGNTALLEQLDEAQVRIKLDNPTFDSDLYLKYYATDTQEAPVFMREERRYVAKKQTVRALYDANWAPISYQDPQTGEFSGILADIFRQIAEDSGLTFQFIPYSGKIPYDLLTGGKAEILCSFERDCTWKERATLNLTAPYLSASNGLIRSQRKTQREGVAVVALNRSSPEQIASRKTEELALIYRDSEADCLAALAQGEASLAYMNTYVADYHLQRLGDPGLLMTELPFDKDDLCIAVPKDADPLLLSILDRSVRFLSDSAVYQIIADNTVPYYPTTLRAYIRQNSMEALLITASVLLLVIASLVYILWLRSKSNRKIYELLYIDRLTGVWNFNKFRIEAEKLLLDSTSTDYALIYTDINRFKAINDRYGYAQSDKLLQILAESIQAELRSGEIVARVSADHFVTLLHYSDRASFLKRMQAVSVAMNTIAHPEGDFFKVTLISGVYLVNPGEHDVILMMDCANQARKTMKDSRRSNYAFFNEQLRERFLLEQEIEGAMERALAEGQFEAYYQPKYDLKTKRIVGAEALVRWNWPQCGVISPGDFIPLFEKNGFVIELDFYIYEQVCIALNRWRELGLPLVPVSSNFSRLHLSRPDFINRIKEIADRYRIPPHLLELEMTESAAEENTSQLVALSQQLKLMDFSLAMDDFGSGYSSLNLLKRLPVDVLKLDKEFLQTGAVSERERIIIKGFVAIAKQLDMSVVCEGVETQEQAAFLDSVDCRIAQGYLYAKPMPLQAFEQRLREEAAPED